MIFAAGLGTRLMPLTANTPKAMVELNGKPLLWYAIQNVIRAGANRIVINTHHFSSQISNYTDNLSFPNVEILISDESDELLETGGGLLKAAPLFIKDAPILIHNADVLTNCDLYEMVQCHQKSNALATLMVQQRKTERYLLFNANNLLVGWENLKTGEKIITSPSDEFHPFAFNGIQIVNYQITQMMGEIRKFSITHGYLDLAGQHPINGWSNWEGQWFDIGTIEKLQKAKQEYVPWQ